MKRLTIITAAVIYAFTLSAQVNYNNNTVNSGNYSSALGEENTSTGLSSLAIGKHDTVTGDYSFAGGINCLAEEGVSFAFGNTAKAYGPYAFSLGGMTTAYSNSFAIGSFCKASGTNSFVIGKGQNSSSLLENSVAYSFMIGINSNKPTFFIGESGGAGHTGKVGIGDVTQPEAKLHIKADDAELAEVFIQPYGWGGTNVAYLWLGTKEYGMKAAYNRLEFKTSSGGKYTFYDGNVGIGTYTPTEKLDVAGKIKTTGFHLVDGQQGAGKYLQSDAEGNASWVTSNVPCFECLTSGEYASTIGMYDTAAGNYSFAGGYRVRNDGDISFAFGRYNTVWGSSSVVLGNFLETATTSAMIIGIGAGVDNKLINPVHNSLMIGFGSNKPTFFVGPCGPGYTGKIGIGDVTDPQAKLHIKGDQDEQASIFIEPYTFGGSYDAELWMGTSDYGLRAAYGKMYFNTGGNYIFNSTDANVGIGVINPLAKLQVNGDVFIDDENSGIILKSPDGQCWKIMVSNNGELTTTSINCDLTTGETEFNQPQKEIIRIYPNPTENKITIENTFTSPVFAMVRDINGTLLITQKLQPGNNEINLENMATGYFLVTILNNENQVITSEKVMKK
jgi:hypothetical protein